MTYLETLYQGKKLLVTSMISGSKKIHPYIAQYVGTFGICLGESKNGMLLIKFGNHTRCIPSSCVTVISTTPIAKPTPVNRFNRQYYGL